MSDPVIIQPAVGVLTLGGNDFHCQVVTSVLTTEQAENRTEAMCGTVITQGPASYFLDVTYFQDWHTGGISTYLYNAAEGLEASAVFSPSGDGTPGFTGTVRLKQPSAGGPPRQAAQDRVRLPFTAKPTLTVDA